jgi:hypothetical protein
MEDLVPAEIQVYIVFVISLLVGSFSLYRMWRLRRSWRTTFYVILTALSLIFLIASGVLTWYYNRPRPDGTQQMLFQGIEYIRDVRDEPRPMIIHIVRVDLDAPGIEFLVSPAAYPDDENIFAAHITSNVLDEYDLQLAINGDFYEPWWSYSPWDYYPHENDQVGSRGLSASQGTIATWGYAPPDAYATLFMGEDNIASFVVPNDEGEIYNAISGSGIIVEDGQSRFSSSNVDTYLNAVHPRNSVAIDESGRELIIVMIDGRQPNYSEGATIIELAEIIIEYGGFTALNLDGGGSVTLVIEDEDGNPHALNSTIDNRIPGRERPVANHLGIYALPLGDE